MIKTVFYFTGTELEYIALYRAGEISPNTIVLCKDTHSLWRNGERYGVGSTSEGGDYVPYDDTALTERIDQIVEELQELTKQIGQSEKGMTEEEKQLMQDLADQLIVIGDGLDTANEVAAAEKERLNGLLDGIQQSINDMVEQAEQDNASIQQLVSDVQSQAAAIQEHAEWILNREEEDSTSWKSGWNANIEAYLQEVGVWARDNGITETQFTLLSQSVDTISSSVNSLQEDVETVKTQFSNISQTADSIETRVASVEQDLDTKATKSQVSELSQTVNGFSTRVSNVETDVAGKVGNTEFSTLSQRVNSIDLAVQALTPSEDGSISDQMQATILQAVRDGVAELNLSSTYAKKSTEEDLAATQLDLDNAEKVLEWMYSGLKLSTAPDKTTSELASAGKDALNNAISDLRTYVQKLKNGDYVASASITSAVNNAIASLYSQSGNNNAKSLIFSKITSNENSISGLLNDVSDIDDTVEQIQSDLSDGLDQINQNTQDIAAIVTAATGDSTSATIATKFSNWKSGLASKSDVESATASLVSSDVFDNTVADLVTKTELNQATSTLAAKTTVENQGTRLSSVETKANQNEATLTNLTKTGGRIAQVEQKATDTEAAISGLVDASTDTVTASKIWESLANDNSVISSMRSQFATTVDGDGIASLVKEDIAQSVNNSTWDQWVSYMKGDVATAVNNYQTATANKAQWDAVVAYVDGKKTAIESIDDLDDSVSNLSTSLAGVSSSVGSLEDEVTGIKNNYAQSSMFASIKDTQGKVTAASIVAAVNGSSGTSKVQIDADHIDVSGVLTVANNAASAATAAQNTANSALTAATTIDGASIKTGTINADRLDISKIVGKINSSTGQNKLTINADHIDVSGVLTVANNAATAASNAASAANAAQTAANNAQSTADSALTATTTIDGGNITTGTINANRLDISAIVGKINDSTGSSKLTIDANHIDVSGVLTVANNAATAANNAQTAADNAASAASAAQSTANSALTATTTIDGGNITTGTINSDRLNIGTIVGKINSSTGTSKVTINADHIQLNGQTVVNSINDGTTKINGGKIDTDTLTAKKLEAKNSTTATNVTTVNGEGITVKLGTNIGFQANANGSGSAAKGNISWSADGKLSVNGAITATSLSLGNNASIAASKVTGLSTVATSGKYTDLSNKPTVPTKVSQLTNDSAFITNSALAGYAKTKDVPTKVSQLTNDSAFITNEALSGYATNQSVSDAVANCLTESDLEGYVQSSDLNGYVKTNVGLGNASSGSYFLISNAGLLTAKNAVITGQVSATSGAIGGILIGNNNIASTNGNFSVTDGGALTAKSGTIGGWTIGTDLLNSGSGTSYVALNSAASNTNAYAMWAGNSAAASAPFSVTKAGALKSTSGTIGGFTISSNRFSSTNNSGSIMLEYSNNKMLLHGSGLYIGTGNTAGVISTNTQYLAADGSGMLASGNIVWNSQGHISQVLVQGEVSCDTLTANYTKSGNVTAGDLTNKIEISGTQLQIKSGNDVVLGLYNDGSAEFSSDLDVDGDADINGTLYVDETITAGGVITGASLKTTGNASIGGDLEVSGTISGSFGALSATSVTANGLTVLGTSTFQSAASGSTSIGTISSMGVFTSSSEEMTLDGAITSTGSLSSSGLTVKQGNTTTISTTSGGAITAAGKIKGGNLEATGSVYSRNLYVRDANANNIFSVKSDGTVSFVGGNTKVSFGDGAYITGNVPLKTGGFIAGNAEYAVTKSALYLATGAWYIGYNDTTSIKGGIAGDLDIKAANSITANKSIQTSSDETLKDIISTVDITVEDIAATRIVNFKYKDSEDSPVYTGAIAQDWKDIIPNAVKKDADDHYMLDYSAVSVVASVTAAREIVALKARIAELESKIK